MYGFFFDLHTFAGIAEILGPGLFKGSNHWQMWYLQAMAGAVFRHIPPRKITHIGLNEFQLVPLR